MGEENAVTMRRELGDGDPLMFLTLPFELLIGGGHQEWSPHVSGGKSGHGTAEVGTSDDPCPIRRGCPVDRK
jgi:hypothetical protein